MSQALCTCHRSSHNFLTVYSHFTDEGSEVQDVIPSVSGYAYTAKCSTADWNPGPSVTMVHPTQRLPIPKSPG